MIRVLLVDEQRLVRLGFQAMLAAEDDIVVVGEAGTSHEAVRLAGALRPDVVVMDIALTPESGVTAASIIANSLEGTGVLLLSADDRDEFAFGAIRAGARGYLAKNRCPDALVDAIRRIAAGEAAVEPRVMRRLLDLFGARLPSCAASAGGPRRDLARDPRLDVLTEREFEIFRGVAQGMSNTELGQAFYLSESTIKTHIGHILMKLGPRDRVHMVMLGYETGVVAPEAITARPRELALA